MTAQAPSKEKTSPPKAQETTRLLLALWELGANKTALQKGKRGEKGGLPDRAKRPATVFNQLVKEGAIKVEDQMVLLETKGVERLAEELKTVDFALNGTTTGAWIARGLLKWLQQMETVTAIASTNGKAKKDAIASYEEFKTVALELFGKLNKDFNYSGLVPIWHMRHEMGDSVEREDFNEWLMSMQGEQLLYLQRGQARGVTDDQMQGSITDDVRGLLFFVSYPS